MAGEDSPLSGLAGRYALALFELAEQQKALDAVAEDLRSLKGMIAGSEDLSRLLRSPLLSREAQGRALDAVLSKAGAGDLLRRFVLVVAENRRLFALPQMIDAFLAELARRRGEVRAEVTTAGALTEEQQQSLERVLNKVVGGNVQLVTKVDPTLLGGLVVRLGSRMIDSSIRSKLQRLKYAMKGVG